MQKLSDVQNVLNRILGSQELFTQYLRYIFFEITMVFARKDQENLKIASKKDDKIDKNTGNFAGKSAEKKFNGNEEDFWYGNEPGGTYEFVNEFD